MQSRERNRLSRWGRELKDGKEHKDERIQRSSKRRGESGFYKNQEYQRKADFIHNLRANGYKVNPKKVKQADVFEYILNHTNCAPWDWDLKEIPQE